LRKRNAVKRQIESFEVTLNRLQRTSIGRALVPVTALGIINGVTLKLGLLPLVGRVMSDGRSAGYSDCGWGEKGRMAHSTLDERVGGRQYFARD